MRPKQTVPPSSALVQEPSTIAISNDIQGFVLYRKSWVTHGQNEGSHFLLTRDLW